MLIDFGLRKSAFIVMSLPGIDGVAEHTAHTGHMPHGVLARPRGNLQHVQPFDNLPRGQLFLDQPTKHVSHDLGLVWMDFHPWREPRVFGKIPVAIRPVRPRQKFRRPRFVQPSAARSVGDLAPFVFGHHPLHLCQELTVGRIPKGIFHKDDATAVLLELFQKQPLMRLTAG